METKSHWKLNLTMLWFSQILVMAGYTAMTPFIPLFIKNGLGITTPGELATYISAYNFFGAMAYAIFCPIWGVLGDRFGIKPMLLRGTFVTAFIFPLMGYSKSPEMLIFLRFLTAGCAGTTAASQIMLARTTPENKQGFALGVLSTAIYGGSVLGNVIGGFLIARYSFMHAFWFCGILYFLAGISVLFTHDDMKKNATKTERLTLRPNFSMSIWIMLGLFFLLGILRNLEMPYIALRIEALSSKDEAAYLTGVISAIVCIGAILSGIIFGYLADKLPARILMLFMFFAAAISLIFHGYGNLIVFTIARTSLFLLAGGTRPVLQKFLSSVTPKNKRGSSFGFSSLTENSGVMAASLMGGVCMTYLGLNGVFFTGAALFIITLPIFLHGIAKCKPVNS